MHVPFQVSLWKQTLDNQWVNTTLVNRGQSDNNASNNSGNAQQQGAGIAVQ